MKLRDPSRTITTVRGWSFYGFLNSSASSRWVVGGGARNIKSIRLPLAAIFLPPANEVWGKVIFLHLSVILFTGGGGVSGQVPPGRYTHPPAGTPLPPPGRYTPSNACWDTVNKRAIRILLECILVYDLFLQSREGGMASLAPLPWIRYC